MTHIEDILFSPILPTAAEEKLKEIIRRVMSTPKNDDFTNHVTHEIVDLLKQYGFTEDKEVADIVQRVIKDLSTNPIE